ncbi:hypothetical protein C8F04DRAFT_1083008 [Mycena alexandri]|uniref:Uncharacterized protein n=1 Tax=Mycena alexandri TaxID=1745969 RepID=A0AAD6T6F3_9AGAR|nr:hypothetical protein C8F04DRAFT_1083008 [Mycena alexandri]
MSEFSEFSDANAFGIGLLDKHERPVMLMFSFFMKVYANRLHPAAASSLRIVDLIRLASLTLGVFSFDPHMTMNSGATWATVHELVNSQLNPQCCFNTLGDKKVTEYMGKTLWISIKGQQHIGDRVLRQATLLGLDTRMSTSILQERFNKTYSNGLSPGDPKICEFTGDGMAVDIMHILPFEVGSSVFSAVAFAMEERASKIWPSVRDRIHESTHDPLHPIIGNIFLLNPRKPLIPRKNKSQEAEDGPRGSGCINLPVNLFIGSKTLHSVDAELHGLLKSVIPAVWLDAKETIYTPVSFTRETTLPRRDPPPKISVVTFPQLARLVFLWLADAYNLYQRFRTLEFKEKIDAIQSEIKQDLEQLKSQKKADERATKAKAKATAGNPSGMDVDKSDKRDDGTSGQGGREHFVVRHSDPDQEKTTSPQTPLFMQAGFERLRVLFTYSSSLEYTDTLVAEDVEEYELTAESKRLLADVFKVQECAVTADHKRITFLLSVAQNFTQT